LDRGKAGIRNKNGQIVQSLVGLKQECDGRRFIMDQDMKDSIMSALEEVLDPELGIDIVNLGLVYEVNMTEEGDVTVKMTLTAMGCPLAGTIVDQVRYALKELPEVKNVEVDIVWTPAWTKDRMSRYAKIALGVQ
jgi:metal-sulfur cluster biosynthetic enzyme